MFHSYVMYVCRMLWGLCGRQQSFRDIVHLHSVTSVSNGSSHTSYSVYLWSKECTCKLCLCMWTRPTWMMAWTMSVAKRRYCRDIPYWSSDWILMAREGLSPLRGVYLCSPLCLDDTKIHNSSKLVANTLCCLSSTWPNQEHQNRKRLDHIYHVIITPRVEGK